MKFLKPYLSYARMCLSVYAEIVCDAWLEFLRRALRFGETYYAGYLLTLSWLLPLALVTKITAATFGALQEFVRCFYWRELTPKFWREHIRK